MVLDNEHVAVLSFSRFGGRFGGLRLIQTSESLLHCRAMRQTRHPASNQEIRLGRRSIVRFLDLNRRFKSNLTTVWGF